MSLRENYLRQFTATPQQRTAQSNLGCNRYISAYTWHSAHSRHLLVPILHLGVVSNVQVHNLPKDITVSRIQWGWNLQLSDHEFYTLICHVRTYLIILYTYMSCWDILEWWWLQVQVPYSQHVVARNMQFAIRPRLSCLFCLKLQDRLLGWHTCLSTLKDEWTQKIIHVWSKYWKVLTQVELGYF